MKYKELINFEPITEVVKFSRTSETDYQKNLVSTFVFSDTSLKVAALQQSPPKPTPEANPFEL